MSVSVPVTRAVSIPIAGSVVSSIVRIREALAVQALILNELRLVPNPTFRAVSCSVSMNEKPANPKMDRQRLKIFVPKGAANPAVKRDIEK
jgi:hypothetical protein